MGAQERLKLLQDTKAAWEGYADGSETVANAFAKAEEEMSKIKKKFGLDDAKSDLAKRQEIYNKTKADLEAVYNKLKSDFDTMALTLPEDKKKQLAKELADVTEKMTILEKFGEKVKTIEGFCGNLELFDNTNKSLDDWMNRAAGELENIKNNSHTMCPEDRVAVCMSCKRTSQQRCFLLRRALPRSKSFCPREKACPLMLSLTKRNSRGSTSSLWISKRR